MKGLEFMGRAWDRLWETGAGMNQPGIGDRSIPWPSFGQNYTPFDGLNPTCSTCSGRMRGAKECDCDEPQWEAGGKKWDINGKLMDELAEDPMDELAEDPMDEAVEAGKMQQMQKWHAGWLKEVFRCLKPGGIAKVFAASRTMHRLAAAMESVGFVLEPDHSIEAWAYGCLSEDTEILTTNGWKHYQEAKVGTSVLGFDLVTAQLSWQVVERTYEYQYDDIAYHIIGSGTDHVVSRDHRCVIWRNGQWEMIIAQNIMQEIHVPTLDVTYDKINEQETQSVVIADSAKVEEITYQGIMWCVQVATGAFVARRNGKVFVTGNSGFPKSLNVSKSIDKIILAQREAEVLEALHQKGFDKVLWGNVCNVVEQVTLDIDGIEVIVDRLDDGTFRKPAFLDGRPIIGMARGVGGENMNDIVAGRDTIRTTDDPGGKGVGAYGTGAKQVAINIPVTAPSSDEAKQFDGYGTSLKPAFEPFIVGRKPLT